MTLPLETPPILRGCLSSTLAGGMEEFLAVQPKVYENWSAKIKSLLAGTLQTSVVLI